MSNYEDMYALLFNNITDVIEQLQNVQLQAEEMYLVDEEDEKKV